MTVDVPPLPPIAIDTREQRSWAGEFTTLGLAWLLGTLRSGDYSLVGFESEVAGERKSLADLVGSLTNERPRFVREIERLAAFDFAFVIVEADVRDVWSGAYRSKATPQSIVGSIAALTIDHRVPFYFASDRRCAADLCARLLTKWWKRRIQRTEAA